MKITWKHILIVAAVLAFYFWYRKQNTITVTMPDGSKKTIRKPGTSSPWGFLPFFTNEAGQVVKTDPVTGETTIIDYPVMDEQKPTEEETKPTDTTTTESNTTTTTDPIKPSEPSPTFSTTSSVEKKFSPTPNFWKN